MYIVSIRKDECDSVRVVKTLKNIKISLIFAGFFYLLIVAIRFLLIDWNITVVPTWKICCFWTIDKFKVTFVSLYTTLYVCIILEVVNYQKSKFWFWLIKCRSIYKIILPNCFRRFSKFLDFEPCFFVWRFFFKTLYCGRIKFPW